jgi:hypothetical protein
MIFIGEDKKVVGTQKKENIVNEKTNSHKK